VVRRIKKNKAAGYDGLLMEVWKYAGKNLSRGLVKILRQVWKEDRIPEDWRKSIIVPIYKREDPNVPSNYRGISLLYTAYKVYAELIRQRLEEQVERIKGLPETQAGLRKGKSTMDNIFILCHLAQRDGRTEVKEKRLYAFFADFSAAFDNVDRDILEGTKGNEAGGKTDKKNGDDLRDHRGDGESGGKMYGELCDKKKSQAGVRTESSII